MANISSRKRRKPHSISEEVYAKTIRPAVVTYYKEIIRFAAEYAAACLRRPRSKHRAQLADLVPDSANENAKEIAAEVFKKLLSGERQDWDGDPKTLRRSVGSCINSILSDRLKRDDNVYTTYIDDANLDWLYSSSEREDSELQPAEESANRYSKAKIIQRLFPDKGYELEVEVLRRMIIHRAFNVEVIADLTDMSRQSVSDALVRLAAYMHTSEFAIRLTNTVGESVAPHVVQEIRNLAAEVVRVRFART
jgi:hypothetical protein